MLKAWKKADEWPFVFTVREAAEYLRFSEATIIRFAKQGILQGVKVGRVWRFSRQTVLNLIMHPELVQKIEAPS